MGMGSGAQGFAVFIVLVLIGLGVFFIYFIFKQIQFVLQAINLYKEILNREDMIISLMKDIFQKISPSSVKQIENAKTRGQGVTCPKCGKTYDAQSAGTFCEDCGASLKP